MAEVIAVGASVIAIIQITDRIIGLCKFYIESVRDASSDLRAILLETSALKTIFENLRFLATCGGELSTTLSSLSGEDGPIEGCRRSITDLEKLFPQESVQTGAQNQSKKRSVKATLATLAWPLKENKARKLLDELMRYKATITLALTTDSMHDIKDIRRTASGMHEILTNGQRQEVYKWLQQTDPSPLHHLAQKNYETGTGNWMLRSSEWADWLDAKHRCLWIHGIPGAGKTVLMSYLIEQVKQHCDESQEKKKACVYYYFYFGHNQDEAVPFLRWLLDQLCRQTDFVPSVLYKMYKHGGQPSLVELLNALAEILKKLDIAYVVVDAIDESNPREDVLKVLRDLATDQRFEKLQLLASSREYIDIETVMKDFSVSVSMDNPFVEEDIRLYVRSTLRTSPKFRRWPQGLLEEVEDAISTGARGMFRWAVCQIDAIQRLKCEREVVKRALANLPKTLNETYDRIFLTVLEEEHRFVHHALQWICFHNDLYNGSGIPPRVLLQAVEKSTAGLAGNPIDRFYDDETLRELCGCLINITLEVPYFEESGIDCTTLAISFAHYTVREYLDSKPIWKGSTSHCTACSDNRNQNCMEIAFLGAYNIRPNELSERIIVSDDVVRDALKGDFNTYCVLSALILLHKWQDEISNQERLCTLAIDLLDPRKPHFKLLYNAALHMEEITEIFYNDDEFWEKEWDARGHFWTVTWSQDTIDSDAVHLFNLLSLSSNNGCLLLAQKFMQGKDRRDFLQSRLNLTFFLFAERLSFDGSIIEVIAQCHAHEDGFRLLMNDGAGIFDPSKALPYSVGSHDYLPSQDGSRKSLLERLFELGADPNMSGCHVTPLQIAVACLDVEAVEMMLSAGADPNDTGRDDGIVWEQGTTMSRFSPLHNASPMYICRHIEDVTNKTADWKVGERQKIEELLLQYGAEEILRE